MISNLYDELILIIFFLRKIDVKGPNYVPIFLIGTNYWLTYESPNFEGASFIIGPRWLITCRVGKLILFYFILNLFNISTSMFFNSWTH